MVKKIKCIKDFRGVDRELHLEISDNISDKEILEIIGMFKRYNFDPKYLEILKNQYNKELFEDIFLKNGFRFFKRKPLKLYFM